MLGINGWEFLLLAVIGLLILGPEKLPGFIADAGRMIRQVRRMATDARAEVVRELGPEFQDINLSDLDPRTFITKHLLDDDLDLDLDGVDLDGEDPAPPRREPRGKSLGAGKGTGGTGASGSAGAGAGGAKDEPPSMTKPTGRHAAPEPPPYDPDAT